MNDVAEVGGAFSRPTQEDCQGGRGYRCIGGGPMAIRFARFARGRRDRLHDLEEGLGWGVWSCRDNVPIA